MWWFRYIFIWSKRNDKTNTTKYLIFLIYFLFKKNIRDWIIKKEKQQLRGSNYSDKMKAKVYYIINNNDCIVG